MAGLTLITDAADGVVGDVKITNGDLSLTDDNDSVALQISQKLKFFFAEWFLDKRQGIPYFERILAKNAEPEYIDATLKDVVLSADYVTRITQWAITVDTDTRELNLEFRADTTFGQIAFSDSLGIS